MIVKWVRVKMEIYMLVCDSKIEELLKFSIHHDALGRTPLSLYLSICHFFPCPSLFCVIHIFFISVYMCRLRPRFSMPLNIHFIALVIVFLDRVTLNSAICSGSEYDVSNALIHKRLNGETNWKDGRFFQPYLRLP